MYFGKIVDGVIVYAPCEIYTNTNEVIVLNTPDDYYEHGYKIVINRKPAYNTSVFKLIYDGFTEKEKTIVINYKLKSIETTEATFEELEKIYIDEINN